MTALTPGTKAPNTNPVPSLAEYILAEVAKHTIWTFEAPAHPASQQHPSPGVSHMKSMQINLEFLSRTKTQKIEKNKSFTISK